MFFVILFYRFNNRVMKIVKNKLLGDESSEILLKEIKLVVSSNNNKSIINHKPEYDGEKTHSHNTEIILNEITDEFLTLLETNNYTSIILSQFNNIFESYKSTNNGVILNESILLKKESFNNFNINGGATINIKDDDINKDLIQYCNDIKNGDNEDIQNFVEENDNNILKSTKYLKDIIKNNKGTIKKNITISYNPVYDYNNCNKKTTPNNDVETSKEFSYKKYNKDIIEAYEKHFLDNFSKWEKFIEKQKIYIENLSTENKRIIQDYTKPSSFDFYKLSKSNTAEDITKFNNDPKLFGDSFYKQINQLYPEKFSKDYQNWLLNNRTHQYSISEFKDILSSDEWIKVLNQFIKDIDNIIKEAPIVTEILYCYRGVSNHYIKNGDYSKSYNVRIFTSDRLSSYTLDFNIAKNFSYLGDKPTDFNCIYRTAIMPFSRILYVAQLSLIPNECEFISPTDSVFIYNVDTDRNDIIPKESYNNINNGYGICSKQDDLFYSLDTILFSTLQPDDYFDKILTDDSDTINNLKTILRSIETITDPDFEVMESINLKKLIFDVYTYSFEKRISIATEKKQQLNKKFEDLYITETISDISSAAIDTFSIVTANLFLQNTKELVNKIIKDNPTIICTQETNNSFNKLMKKNKYDLVTTNNNTGTERIDIYIKNGSGITIIKSNIISTEKCHTDRADLIIDVLYNNTIIKIGIVHLCGGRFDEAHFTTILKENKIKDISTKIDKIKEIKEEQINKMIAENVDIILGDFNSDIEHYLGTLNYKQQKYFKDIEFDDNMIEVWNKKPFELLEEYSSVCGDIDNCKKFYNTNHTSKFETSPDAIYYNNKKLTVNNHKIIDLLTNELSDHNGIYAEFRLEKKKGGYKYRKTKNIKKNQKI